MKIMIRRVEKLLNWNGGSRKNVMGKRQAISCDPCISVGVYCGVQKLEVEIKSDSKEPNNKKNVIQGR